MINSLSVENIGLNISLKKKIINLITNNINNKNDSNSFYWYHTGVMDALFFHTVGCDSFISRRFDQIQKSINHNIKYHLFPQLKNSHYYSYIVHQLSNKVLHITCYDSFYHHANHHEIGQLALLFGFIYQPSNTTNNNNNNNNKVVVHVVTKLTQVFHRSCGYYYLYHTLRFIGFMINELGEIISTTNTDTNANNDNDNHILNHTNVDKIHFTSEDISVFIQNVAAFVKNKVCVNKHLS